MASTGLERILLSLVYFISQGLYNTGRVSACLTNSEVFSRINGSGHFSYSVKDQLEGVSTFIFSGPESDLAQFVYNSNNNVISTQTVRDVTVSADWDGNIRAIKSRVTTSDIGKYFLTKSGRDIKLCSFLYILGTPTKPQILSNYTTVGEDATLVCNSTSTTKPTNHSLGLTYRWEINNVSDISNMPFTYSENTLEITNVTERDAKLRYVCTATENVQGGFTSDKSDMFSFNIAYGPDKETTVFTPSASSYILEEGDMLEDITCLGFCFPTCEYKWMKKFGNETSIANNSEILSLGNVYRNETATYICSVKNEANNRSTSKQVTVSIRYGPDEYTTILSPPMTSYTVLEHTDLTNITCSGDCYPQCVYNWTRKYDGRIITTGHKQVLSLGQLDREDADTYICTVSNPDITGTVTREISIKVIYGPDLNSTVLVPSATTYILDEGTLLNDIYCAGNCFPECEYYWTMVDRSGETYAVNQSAVLSLGLLDKLEAAIYICTVSNPHTNETVSKEVSVSVRYGPDENTTVLSPSKNTYTVDEFSVLDPISCVSDCFPLCRYTWTREGSKGLSIVSNSTGLSFGMVTRQDAAVYLCTVTNQDGNSVVTKWIIVHVIFGPDRSITSLKTPYVVTEGDEPEDIACSSNCYPVCSNTWTNVTSGRMIGAIGHFSLGTVTRYLSGDYVCKSQNAVTKHVEQTTLKIVVSYASDVSTRSSTTNFMEINTTKGESSFNSISTESKNENSTSDIVIIVACVCSALVIIAVCLVIACVICKGRSKRGDNSQETRVSYAGLQCENVSGYEEPARYVSITVCAKPEPPRVSTEENIYATVASEKK